MLEILQLLKEAISVYGTRFPWVIFTALVILPGFGFPASALLLLAGAIWGSSLQSGLTALAAIALNISWTHSLAAGPGRHLAIRLLGDRWLRWHTMPRNDHLKLACLLRLTPGVPLFVQNYVLGLLGVPLRESLLIAIPVTGLYVFGFVLTGGALFEGKTGLAVTGLSLVVVAAIGVRFAKSRFSSTDRSAKIPTNT
jgi:uncharacterized membrane protein YdjX (TVP38/TMEM64 family)